MPEQVDAVSRVVSYPLVRDSWSKFSEVYQRGKDGSRILRMCGSLAESSAMLAFNASQPVLSRLPVETVNSLAVQTLDEMEQKFPLMTKPTSEMVDSVKSYSLSKIDEAKSYGVDQFNRLADRTRLTSVLDFADVTVDTLLPAEHEADGDSAMAPAGPAEPAPVDASSKLRLISSKVRQRSYQRAMSRVKCLEKKSAETVGKLMYTVDLIDYAKRNLSGLSYEKTRNKVKDIYTEIVAEEENEPEMPETDMNMERKAIYAARRLTLRARSTFSSVSGLASALPEQTRDRLNQAVAYTESLYQSLSQIDSYKEISSQLIAQFREKLMYLQSVADSLTSTMAESSPIQWLVMDLEFDTLGHIEPPEYTYGWVNYQQTVGNGFPYRP